MMAFEPMTLLRRRAILPLLEHATGRLIYAVRIGDLSGDVYFNVIDRPFGVNVSHERIALSRLQSVLAAPLATGEPFQTRLLLGAVVNRAKHNGAVLAAILRHEGLLTAAPDRPQLHVCTGDWQDWAYAQRERLATGEPSEPRLLAEPTSRPTLAG